jgi:transposase-like protein
MDDLSLFCCQNPGCPAYGLRDRDNRRVGFRYGPRKQRRMLVCRTWQARFSQRKGTALFACRLPEGRALAVFQPLQDGWGVRQTARRVGVDKDTAVRYALRAGTHAQQAPDEPVVFSPGDPGGAARGEPARSSTSCASGLAGGRST